MPTYEADRLRDVRTFPSLVKYLRDELGWPIESDDFDDLTFDWEPEELGIDSAHAAKIQQIKQLRPLAQGQPFGIFFVKFEPKRLPVVALRRILGQVTLKKRASARAADRAAWAADDLLFISNYGDGEERRIAFAHFSQPEEKADLPTLKVLGWDNLDTLLHLDDVADTLATKLKWPASTQDAAEWREGWRSAFTLRVGEAVNTSRELSVRLAKLARAIRDRIRTALAIETERGPLTKLMKAFQESLVHDLDTDGFADMYAQTIAYGLLSARIANPHSKTADDLSAHMQTNPFLKELMETFLRVGGRRGKVAGSGIDFDELGVGDVVELLDAANMGAVVRDFGDRNPQEDPVIHFYELFLKEYDAKKRMQRGVFYTPRPVVSYIVRSVDELLRTEFGLEDGLADISTWSEMVTRHPGLRVPEGVSPQQAFVQILDPATGTGTFLVEAIDLIHHKLVAKWTAQGHSKSKIEALWNDYVTQHLLPRLHGYELLMAPYAIAHLKIGLKLYETGYRFESDERVRVYLTNSLEPASDLGQMTLEGFLPALAHEAQAVNAIKGTLRFTVVIGNPPYAAASHNPSVDDTGQLTHVGRLIRRYFEIGGEPLRESNPRWLQDDYVKFLRLAESYIEQASTGVVGMITNHGYVANPTFRGMRHSLLRTYSTLRIVDLHGNSKRGETAPDGSNDENVFDIQQGVAISLLCRSAEKEEPTRQVQHHDLYGTRTSKYAALMSKDTTSWQCVHPAPPFLLFLPQDEALRTEFESAISLPSVFLSSSVGIVTGRDALTIHFTKAEAAKMAELFTEMPPEAARRHFDLGPDTRDWRVAWARKDLMEHLAISDQCTPVTYRPFDVRFTYYTGNSRGFHCMPRGENMRHLRTVTNLGLVTARSNKSEAPDHFFCSRFITEAKCGEATTQSCVFPLYLAPEEGGLGFGMRRRVALTPSFLSTLARSLGVSQSGPDQLPCSISAEDILGYGYAVFYSHSYRTRFAQFLKIDFPRLPLPGSLPLFRELSLRGSELIALHLMESSELERLVTTYTGPRNPEVQRVGWAADNVWLDACATRRGQPSIPGTIGFGGVPEQVWNFHIGGYQVCEKWLKDRKGRRLSKDDIVHYQKIILAISETLRLMKEIDEAIEKHGGWPGAFQTAVPDAGKLDSAQPVTLSSQPSLLPDHGVGQLLDADAKEAPDATNDTRSDADEPDDSSDRIPIEALDTDELMAIIRRFVGENQPIEREAAIRGLASELGYERVGSRVREALDNGIRTAVRRGVLTNEAGDLSVFARSVADYERDFLKEQFLASLQGGAWQDRAEAIRGFARWLGFRRTGSNVDEAARSLVNGLLREGRLETDGPSIRRA